MLEIVYNVVLKNLKNLKTIGEKAFSACYVYNMLGTNYITNSWSEREVYSGLKEVILPDCVTELGKGAFSNNYYMQTLHWEAESKIFPNCVLEMIPKIRIAVHVWKK